MRLVAEPACWIDGVWEAGTGAVLQKLDPTDRSILGEFTCADVDQVRRAIGAARRTFEDRSWRGLTPAARSARLHRLADLMEANADALLDVVVADIGTAISFARGMQLEAAVASTRWFAEAAMAGPDGWFERSLTPDQLGATKSESMLVREPVGVVAAIGAYNFPFTMVAWKVCGALAAGCSVVMQPASRAALSTVALWRLIEEIDLPTGTANLVLGEAEVGRALTTDPDVDMVSFTGSAAVGAEVMSQAAATTKRLVLELGGKSANILLPGVDVGAAVEPSVMRLVTNTGQRCGATSRILVHEDDAERFTEALRGFVGQLRVGNPRDPRTVVGPLIDERHLRFVQGHVDAALADGATVVAGGGPAPADVHGYFMNPVILGGLSNSSTLCQTEQFGPVGALITYADVDEAVAIANDSAYGLNANVFGPDAEAIAVARRVKSGTVTINGGGRNRPDAPWGGYRQSGIGREAGDEGFREFFEVKHIQWPMR